MSRAARNLAGVILPPLLLVSLATVAAMSDAPPAAPAPAQPDTEAPPPTMGRGMLLYENHCLGCHESRLHLREHRSARNMDELKQWVARWAGHQKLTWDANDVEDVARYLNLRYYNFPPTKSR